ncbi:hypothetical protein DFH07DRAFT_795360 [Mycena maculata]|uniref:Secreted protein n=1 Tax=Mycena maculata TaxID=230809 RepID=A0AAD7NWY2_9AGAR|nr:hypothetical protein DFH07DRAFT_795360 [Mycena maculata]
MHHDSILRRHPLTLAFIYLFQCTTTTTPTCRLSFVSPLSLYHVCTTTHLRSYPLFRGYPICTTTTTAVFFY